MKGAKEDAENRSWVKSFEKRLLVNFAKAHDFVTVWRAFLCSREFWNLSWLWTAFLMKLCTLRIKFSVGQGHRQKLMMWVSSNVPGRYLESGFPECFRDGILLCALTEKLSNGACPRFDLLDPDQPLRNLKLALYLIEKHVKIKPGITAGEILQGGTFSEKSLVLLIAHIKLASETLNLCADGEYSFHDFMSQTTFVSDRCFARGMGLLLAVRGRKACFTIVLDSTDNLDMVIEIRGPKNTACNTRIASVHSLVRGDSPDMRDVQDAQMWQEILSQKIPLTYRILGRKITVYYTPLESGTHHMNIIWQGQHIMGSPYIITVDNSVEMNDVWYQPPKQGYNNRLLGRSDSQYYDGSIDSGLATSAGKVTRKRILRYIVKIDGSDVVIDGKEDLCKAIKYLRKQRQNTSSEAEENGDSEDERDSDYFSPSESENIPKNNCETDNGPNTGSVPSLENEFSQNIAHNTGVDTDWNCEYKDSQLLNDVDFSKCLIYCDATIENKENNFSVNKNTGLVCEQEKSGGIDALPHQDFETSDFSKSFCEEQYETIVSDIETAKDVNDQSTSLAVNGNSEMPKLTVTLSDEKVEDLPFNPGDYSNNNLNSRTGSLHGEDFNFFPVHKVEYELLIDDDVEDPYNFNQGRRRSSFTELNEVNYLDDDSNEAELGDTELEENINSDEKKEDYQSENEEQGYDGTDVENCLRRSHSLFQCNHSLSLFTDSVVETPPELATSENEDQEAVSVGNITNTWENELKNLKVESGLNNEITVEDYKSDDSTNVEHVAQCPPIVDFSEVGDSEAFDPFSSENANLIVFESEDFNPNLKPDLAERRRRFSWCDREFLPCIRESSVEGLLESEKQEDMIRNREMSDNSSYLSQSKIQSKSVTKSSSMPENVSSIGESFDKPLVCPSLEASQTSSRKEELLDTNTSSETDLSPGIKNDIPPKNEPAEITNKRPFSSMNILSASPYINRSQNGKTSEVKFSTGASLDKQPSQTETNNQPVNPATPDSEKATDAFILTYAKPVIVEECANENKSPKRAQEKSGENISETMFRITDYHDSSDPKPVQCMSVKKVIQIFQKEKEEPVDTWPAETGNSPYCRRKFKEDILSPKNQDKVEPLESETPLVEISCSSIKDRVKLFEKEGNDVPSVKKPNPKERRSSSSISAKKDYWENIAS